MTTAAGHLPVDMQTLWFVTRAAGLVSLVLLSLTVVLGVLSTSRVASGRLWPRFVDQGLHRNISLIALALLVIHIGTAIADDYVSVRLRDVVLPFGGLYRPLWLGAGSAAIDLLLLVAITSLVRVHLGHRTWRRIHWAAYGCWTLAIVHGLGTGSDAKVHWALLVQVGCGAAVVLAVLLRLSEGWPSHVVVRACSAVAVGALIVIVVQWTLHGPLAPGWSHRSGTPAKAAQLW
ncbi:hypothetical protein acdb102_33200 [Acidothermaceae bacterium B102]|nr:hypothetical protein acdb102_33200 [Acidothermaceae bacterium B102]